MRQNLSDGLDYLRANTVILVLTILYLLPWLAGNTFTSFLPVFASDILKIGAVGYGYLQAAPGLGAIASLIALTFFTYYKNKSTLLIASGVLMAICLLGFSASTSTVASLFLLVVIGAMQSVFSTVNTTLIQGAVPDELRGRIISWREVAFGLGPTGSVIFGAIAQVTGVQVSVGLLGLIILVPSLLLIAYLPRAKGAL
jgi:predicted MFS family arabinose efflux permease